MWHAPCSNLSDMKGPTAKALCAILSLTMVLPCGTAKARGGRGAETHRPQSILVAPVTDGDMDDRSAEIASAISDALRLDPSQHVLDSALAAKVVGYHAKPDKPEGGAEDAAASLSRAKEAYFAFRYDEARRELDRAIEGFEAEPQRISYSGAGLLDAHVTRAMIARSAGDDELARLSISRALAVDPNLELFQGEYPPRLIALLAAERARLSARGVGELTVSTKPEAAKVRINGVPKGQAPLALTLPAGRYRLLIEANRYSSVEREIEVNPGGTAEVKENLKWVRNSAGSPAEKVPSDDEGLFGEGMRLANIMKADKVVLVGADGSDAGWKLKARMVDGVLKLGQPPIAAEFEGAISPESLAGLTAKLSRQAGADLIADLARGADIKGSADPALLSKRKRPLKKNPVFWAIVGTALAGALVGGLAAAFSGASGDRGGVKVRFR